MNPFVEIVRADGSFEQHRLEGDRVTVGQGPGADIVIASPDLEPQHLLLAPRPDGCWVSVVETARTQAVVNGSVFTNGMVAWGSTVELGPVRLTLTDKLPPPKSRQKAVSSPLAIAMIVIIPVAGYLLLTGDQTELPTSPDVAPPALFEPSAPCGEQGEAALFKGREAYEGAEAKSDRYPFDPQDGIEAARLYDVAAVCFTAGGDADSAAGSQRRRRALTERIDYDFRTHKVRLERALEYKHYADAIVEVGALRALVRHRDTPYTQWLVVLERQLQVIIDQGARRR